MSATVYRKADFYYVSVLCEVEDEIHLPINKLICGIDIGLNDIVTIYSSLGKYKTIKATKPFKSKEKKLARYQRIVARKVKGSKRYGKAQNRVARLQHKIQCVRDYTNHTISKQLTDKYGSIGIEDLAIKEMKESKLNLGKAISDVAIGDLVTKIAYKAEWKGRNLVKVDRYFSSSKICSCCGYRKTNLSLSDRNWKCNRCGRHLHRDKNAAKNIEQLTEYTILYGIEYSELEYRRMLFHAWKQAA